MYTLLKKNCSLQYKKLNLKMLTCFGMIWNYDNFSRRNTKFVHFLKILFIQNWLLENWYIGTTINIINKKFQNISFQKSSFWKHDSLAKGPPKRQ